MNKKAEWFGYFIGKSGREDKLSLNWGEGLQRAQCKVAIRCA